MKKIFISTTSFAEYDSTPLDICKKAGYTVECNPYGRKIKREELVELANDAVGLIAGTEELTKESLLKLPSLKVISRCGTGLDNVDMDAACNLGIRVFNTPDAPAQAVAELTIGLMLDSLRHISHTDRMIRRGEWKKPMGNLLYGKTVGVIGYGRIGKQVSKLAMAFGAKIIAFDIKPCCNAGVQTASFDELIANSDIITLHLSCNDQNNCLIDARVISRMKEKAHIINTSRGGFIDEDALYEALQSGKLAGAAIDTFTSEPYTGKISKLDNAIVTSHIGSYAKESRIAMEKQAVENLLNGLGVKI